jgi:2-phosphosulfolactate phosphatase
LKITIYQGNDHILQPSDITIVIDVIRAFTVAHYAFIKGAEKIFLVGTVEEAFRLKEQFPNYLLAGEVKGLPIEGFDLDNSPVSLMSKDVMGKSMVQKTTNGVKATLHSLHAEHLFVTGFSNARTTATFIKEMVREVSSEPQIHIVASHPEGDDDLACAEFIKGILEGSEVLIEEEVKGRIKNSVVTAKFFDPAQPEFNPEDITYCMKEIPGAFLMKVNKNGGIPVIERFQI